MSLHVYSVKYLVSLAGAHLLSAPHLHKVDKTSPIFGYYVQSAYVVISAQVLSTHDVPDNLQYFGSHLSYLNPSASLHFFNSNG